MRGGGCGMTAKDYLSQTWRINRMIDAKLEQVLELRELAKKASTTLSHTRPSGTRNVHSMEDVIIKILSLESDINSDIDNLLTLKQNITSTIKSISNPDYKVLLELRYLCFKAWDDIARTMNYGRKYIFRLHEYALSQVRVPDEVDTKIT
jgi:hypothetical protein